MAGFFTEGEEKIVPGVYVRYEDVTSLSQGKQNGLPFFTYYGIMESEYRLFVAASKQKELSFPYSLASEDSYYEISEEEWNQAGDSCDLAIVGADEGNTFGYMLAGESYCGQK